MANQMIAEAEIDQYNALRDTPCICMFWAVISQRKRSISAIERTRCPFFIIHYASNVLTMDTYLPLG